jgi:hypothetical protein
VEGRDLAKLGVFLEEIIKIPKFLSLDSQCPCRYPNWASPEYTSETLPLGPSCLVILRGNGCV